MNDQNKNEALRRLAMNGKLDGKTMATRHAQARQAQEDESNELARDFLPGGVLSQRLSGYQPRRSQVETAKTIGHAFKTGQNANIEAQTGTGKSLAYLVTAVRTGRKTVVSTANKALQSQLVNKDAVFVRDYVQNFAFAEYKGRGNYVCLDRLQKALTEGHDNMWHDDATKLQKLIEDSDADIKVFNGDFDMLPFPITGELKPEVQADRDMCAWKKCTFFDQCYLRKARQTLEDADVVITNHSLLVIDAECEQLLPAHSYVVIDEAHQLEEIATGQLSTEIRPTRITSLLNVKRVREHCKETYQKVSTQFFDTWEVLKDMYEKLSLDGGSVLLSSGIEEGKTLASRVEELALELATNKPGKLTEKEETLHDQTVKRALKLSAALYAVFSVDYTDNYIYQIKRDDKAIYIARTPLNVSEFLREYLFEKNTCVSISATLATGTDFSYYRNAVGSDLPGTIERVLPPVFDYASNARLYIPRNFPLPAYEDQAAREYEQAIAAEMLKLVKCSQGGAFLLFTSGRMLNATYKQIGAELEHSGYPLFVQSRGVSPKLLIEGFKASGNGVLFGLKSYWEGVDVQGDALSLVVVDKLPFVPTNDPVKKARIKKIEAEGQNAFAVYTVPEVILKLKQGVGRLIRTHTDKGVMAILDARLYTKRYGREVIAALPPARIVNRIEDVQAFFDEVRNG